MAVSVPTWARRLGLAVLATAVLGAVAARTFDVKQWLAGQLAVPHGRGGRLVALVMPAVHESLYGPAAELLRLRPDDEVLDVGCGSGAFLARFAGEAKRVAGLDASDIQVNLARRRLEDRIAAGTAEVVRGDAAALPWQDWSFSAVTCLGSLDFFADADASVREMYRVLRPGGRVVVTYGVDETDEKCVRDCEAWGLPHQPEEEARALLERAGFASIEITYPEQGHSSRFLYALKR